MLRTLLSIFFPKSWGRSSVSQQTETKIKSDWNSIRLALTSKNPSQLKQALITADKSLDNALRDVVAGETMGERLKASRDKFDRDIYNKLWEAHKIRNNLVHESGYEPPYFMLIQAIEHLREGLSVLGVRV